MVNLLRGNNIQRTHYNNIIWGTNSKSRRSKIVFVFKVFIGNIFQIFAFTFAYADELKDFLLKRINATDFSTISKTMWIDI